MAPPKKTNVRDKSSPGAEDAGEPDSGPADEDQSQGASSADQPEVGSNPPVGEAEPEEELEFEGPPSRAEEAAAPGGAQDEHQGDDPIVMGPARAAEIPKQSEPVTENLVPPPYTSTPAPRSGGGFWTGLLGALIGAAVGAGAVWYMLREMPRAPDPEVAAALDRQSDEVAGQSDRIAAFEGELAALKETVGASDPSEAIESMKAESEGRLGTIDASLTDLGGRIGTVEASLDDVAGSIDEVGARLDSGEARLVDLEARPIADPETANQVLRSEVADMRQEVEQATEAARARVDTMRNELDAAAEATQTKVEAAAKRAAELETQAQERAAAAESEAEASARAVEAKAALTQVVAALDTGEPYGDTLAKLSDTAGTAVPDALSAAAESGVPTLSQLRDKFPDAARAALRSSRVATTEGDASGRVMAFLRTQTQARSLAPKDGDTPDAILSRAEAALDAGEVAAAIAELDALPDDGRAAMQDWIDGAEVRAHAVAAAEALSQDIH